MNQVPQPYPLSTLTNTSSANLQSKSVSGGVSWPSIFAGAVAAASLSLILLMLGAGLGLSAISPLSADGVDATAVGFSTIAWLSFTQLAASGLGGYLAGRLLVKWPGVHSDEVYFRDTAHGFLAWAVATLLTASLLSTAVGSIVGGSAKAGATIAAGAVSIAQAANTVGAAAVPGSKAASASPDSGGDTTGYFVDSLFRKDVPNTEAVGAATPPAPGPDNKAAASGEVTRIMANAIAIGSVPPQDLHYLGQLIAQRTGLSQQDAEKRLTDTYSKFQTRINDAKTAAKDVAEKARKASSYASLWLFISLLLGAFVASLVATIGGRHREALALQAQPFYA